MYLVENLHFSIRSKFLVNMAHTKASQNETSLNAYLTFSSFWRHSKEIIDVTTRIKYHV